MSDPIKQELAKQGVLALDGAMATELEKLGVATNNELWSATALINAPEKIKQVHLKYFAAGATIAITDTYQANVTAFKRAGFSLAQSQKMILTAVELAKAAREEFLAQTALEGKAMQQLLLAGSVGPYGAYLADGSEYTGAYKLTQKAFQDFHRSRMQLLADAGVDLFAFETLPQFEEAKALVALLHTEFSRYSAWLSFSIKDATHLCDGTSLAQAAAFFAKEPQISAIGVNCTTMTKIADAIKTIAQVTTKPIIVYPNNGDLYEPQTKTWVTNPQAATFSELVPTWIDAGAKIIGGCCRTTPADIRQIAAAIQATKLT
ncbi:homocysteine S-methyltransferase [Liquorilactobacillus satsumensis]|uniref:S-methylmethionine:homocysteine methyltransferase n=2 Tax=Liquorilactobacillus satsumensis TaxID=259059 RepID=A0A0R1UXH1_9LACO|nr:homocysteine S-methyltransferase [Liquorilactobacillus satsumensis]KRL97774.1 homocysteine methyltransferase [Liquorilactobacillus satsumensis DSM 16230 = JCM 12392]